MRAGFLFAAALLPLHAASAQDVDPGEPVAGGLRIEALAGYDTDGFEHGALAGGRVGYDVRVAPRFLLGLDAEINDVTTDQEILLPAPTNLFTVEDGPDLYVGGRTTFALARQFQLYGGAGYTRARHGSFFAYPTPGGPGFSIGGQELIDEGYRLTAGGRFLLGRHAFLGAEYRYSDYGDPIQHRNQIVGSIGFRF
jgi:outer membrane immunogenic protein